MLTNSRIAETLSLLGYDYSNQQNVSSLVEYEFDVVIDVWMEPEVVIATGSLKNIADRASTRRGVPARRDLPARAMAIVPGTKG